MPLTDYEPSLCPDFNPNNSFGECERYLAAKNPKVCGFCKLDKNYRCIADVRRIIPLSHSSIGNYLTCHYLYYLTAIRGIQTFDHQKSSALKMGSLWDNVQQVHLQPGIVDRMTGKPIDIPSIINQYQISPRDVAKVRALYRAYKTMEVKVEPGFELQSKISLTIPFNKSWGNGYPVEVEITGFYDRLNLNTCSFVEGKLSSSPDRYFDPFFIQSQIGAYFLADPNLLECTMEVVRTPDLKSTGKYKDEDDDTYSERVYQDILSRPTWYFPGWNNTTRKFGKKFYRSEFDLDEIRTRFLHCFREIHDARIMGGWYKNDRVCNQILPGIPCEMLPICRHGKMSEEVFKIREKDFAF